MLLWKTFARISKGLYESAAEVRENAHEWIGEAEIAGEANGWASISLTNQKIVDALMESLKGGGSIPIEA